jgi:ATP-binding cassette, subfamily B, bacterial PglK
MIKFFSKFLYVLRGRRKVFLGMVFLFLFTSILEVLGIGSIGPFMALATNPSAIEQNHWLNLIYSRLHLRSKEEFLLIVGFLVIFIFYVKSYISFNSQRFIFNFSYTQQGELSSKLMRLYLAAPYTFHLNRNSATLIQNIINETSQFVNSLMIPLLVSISNAIVICALVLLLAATNVIAVLIISGIILISFLFFQSFKDKVAGWGKAGSEAHTEIIRLINHGLGGFKETRVIGCESYFDEKLQEQAKKYATNISLGINFASLPRFVVEALLITFLVAFTLLFLNINHGKSENINSILGIFALASIRLLPATSNFLSSINGIRYNIISLDKIYHEFKELERTDHIELEKSEKNKKMLSDFLENHLASKIVLDKIFYRYPNTSKTSLNGISLEIKKGQSIGLIGKSGAGKTTLVDVILGLLVPQEGDIRVNGVSIYEDLRSWQNMIGYVPQSIFLIDDTLERNIAFGVPDHLIDPDRLYKSIEAAQLTELVEQLSDGIKTIIGERGVLLSGGQRQRIGIARSLYHEREILVLDEATSALDNETEALVTEAIKSLSGTKTMIIIAHRLTTIEHCDCIYMLDKGQVVKSGSFSEVVSDAYQQSDD